MTIAELIKESKAQARRLLVNILERRVRIKSSIQAVFSTLPHDVFVIIIILLSSALSFGLGMLTERHSGNSRAFSIKELPLTEFADTGKLAGVTLAPETLAENLQVVASKNGTRYYFTWCSGSEKLSEKNKVWFQSPQEAEANGYTVATGCD